MLNNNIKEKLLELSHLLVHQGAAKIIIAPQENAAGFWFGGGNMIETAGKLYLCGRYRNSGDSRLGVSKGQRGLELAIFRSDDRGQNWGKIVSFSKTELGLPGKKVLCIEGSALHLCDEGVELFVSTEKAYNPLKLHREFVKPGTGSWSIERITAPTVEQLSPKTGIHTVAATDDPSYLHVKDPFIYDLPSGDLALLFCTHPFTWSSSNTAYFVRKRGNQDFIPASWDFMRRGLTWDVAMRRGTTLLDLPQQGILQDKRITLFFYDGGESLRNMDEHDSAIKRPRGYSCEELGGVGYIENQDVDSFKTLSPHLAEFLSPWGTACSRYVDTLATAEGIYVTWQQS